MAELETVTVSGLPNAATPLTGSERVLLDQATGSVLAASALVAGKAYRIEVIGNTNWLACGVPSGVTPVIGLTFQATAPGSGTGTAIEIRTVDAPVQAIADLIGEGPAGPQGPAGPAGATGPAGAAGPQGPQGPAGPAGPQGAKGDTGATGATGPQGPAGATGPAGAQGPAGTAGAAGTDGREVQLQTSATHVQWRYAGQTTWNNLVPLSAITGPQGATGATGAQGPAGANGQNIELQTSATHIQWRVAGTTSWTNLVSLASLTGPQGPAGATGATGATGSSAYEVAVAGGFVGTQAQWLASLVGPQGATGAMGPQGPAGPAGATGPQGPQGATGATGATGAQGPAGPTGATGPAGPIAGSSGQVSFNNAGTADGASGLTVDLTSKRLNLASFVPLGITPSTPSSGFTLYAASSNALSWIGANGFTRTIDATGITANRVWNPPDRNGTIALAEDLGGSATTRAANLILAGPTSGSAAAPTFRALVAADLPAAPTEIGLACSDETTALTTGTAKITIRMPYAMTLTSVRLSVTTAPTGSALIVDVNEGGTSIFSTNPRIDAGSTTSVGSGTPAVISDTALADNAVITVDIDQIGSTVAGTGLKVWLIGRRA